MVYRRVNDLYREYWRVGRKLINGALLHFINLLKRHRLVPSIYFILIFYFSKNLIHFKTNYTKNFKQQGKYLSAKLQVMEYTPNYFEDNLYTLAW